MHYLGCIQGSIIWDALCAENNASQIMHPGCIYFHTHKLFEEIKSDVDMLSMKWFHDSILSFRRNSSHSSGIADRDAESTLRDCTFRDGGGADSDTEDGQLGKIVGGSRGREKRVVFTKVVSSGQCLAQTPMYRVTLAIRLGNASNHSCCSLRSLRNP